MEWPLTLAALLFLATYAWPILDPGLSQGWRGLCFWTGWAVWALFILDYLVRLLDAEDRPRWLLHHPLDLVMLALPMLRPLRALRLVTLLRVLNRSAAGNLRGRVAVYVTGGSSLIAFVAALAVLDVERHAEGANITSFGDAMWWATTTMTTVGYGDQFPITTPGRVVGVALMIGGITLLGTVTATFASWLLEAVREESEETGLQLDDLHAELRAVRERLDSVLDEAPQPGGALDSGR